MNATTSVTDREQAVLEAVRTYQAKHFGISPSIRDLMELTGVTSTSVINYYLERLERKGLIWHLPGIARGIVLKSNPS